MVPPPGHRERFNGDSGTGGAESGTPGALGRGFRDRWGGKWDTGTDSEGFSGQVVLEMGHRARFNGVFGTGGAGNGAPGTVGRGFRDRWGEKWDTGRGWRTVGRGFPGQVGLEMGHRERLEDGWAGILRQVGRKVGHRVHLGGDSGTGGAGNGTPGVLGRGFRDRWGGKWDTGRGWRI